MISWLKARHLSARPEPATAFAAAENIVKVANEERDPLAIHAERFRRFQSHGVCSSMRCHSLTRERAGSDSNLDLQLEYYNAEDAPASVHEWMFRLVKART